MGQIVKFPDGEPYKLPDQTNQEIIDKAKDLLAQAETGNLVGIAYVGIYVDGGSRTGWRREENALAHDRLISAVGTLYNRLIKDS